MWNPFDDVQAGQQWVRRQQKDCQCDSILNFEQRLIVKPNKREYPPARLSGALCEST
jgi:hypothetical protein